MHLMLHLTFGLRNHCLTHCAWKFHASPLILVWGEWREDDFGTLKSAKVRDVYGGEDLCHILLLSCCVKGWEVHCHLTLNIPSLRDHYFTVLHIHFHECRENAWYTHGHYYWRIIYTVYSHVHSVKTTVGVWDPTKLTCYLVSVCVCVCSSHPHTSLSLGHHRNSCFL